MIARTAGGAWRVSMLSEHMYALRRHHEVPRQFDSRSGSDRSGLS